AVPGGRVGAERGGGAAGAMEGVRGLGPLREVPRGGRPHAHARSPRRQGGQDVTLVGLAVAGAVKARARELGFDLVAIGKAGSPEHGPAFERWLAAGHAATMDYLARGREDRLDPDRLLPGCRSVVAVALAYARDDDDPSWTPVARYARGRDYHDVMRPRLGELGGLIARAGGAEVRYRAAVDSSAGLGPDLA